MRFFDLDNREITIDWQTIHYIQQNSHIQYSTIEYVRRHHKMHDLTGFQRDLLYAIAGRDEPHGLAIKEELEDYYEKEIHHGRLYPNLDTLVDKGLVDKGEFDRRTNVYGLTSRGRRELDARREWEGQYVDVE